MNGGSDLEGQEWRQMLSEFLIIWHMCVHKLRCECVCVVVVGHQEKDKNCNPISYRETASRKGFCSVSYYAGGTEPACF